MDPAPAASPVEPRRTGGPRRFPWPLVAPVAVAAVVVVGGLAYFGVIPLRSGHGSAIAADSYREAAAQAGPAVGSAYGGPWTVVAALGLGIASAVTDPNLTVDISLNCTPVAGPGTPSRFTLPATPSDAPAGDVAAWIFAATNASDSTVLFVEITPGSPPALDWGSGSACVSWFRSAGGLLGSAWADSPAIAASFDAHGAESFLAANPSATREFYLLGPSGANDGFAVWSAAYTVCPPDATGGSGAGVVGTFFASTGSLVGVTNVTSSCVAGYF